VLLALIGYIGTMLVAFAALVAAWFVVIGPPPQRQLHQPPHAIGAIAQTAAPAPAASAAPSGTQPGTWGPPVVHRADDGAAVANTDEARAAAEQAAAEKAKQLKLARYRKRKEQLARRRQEQHDQQDAQYGWTYSQPYSTALGYDRESARDRPPPPAFFLFGPPRY